jgi:hypothetical protein
MATNKAAIPNPSLELLNVLVGSWTTVASHPALEGTMRGRATFAWMEGGAFLIARSGGEEPGVPSAVMVIGRDGSQDGYTVLYFDERGVSRVYEMSLEGNVWRMWRDAPEHRQRFTGTITDDGKTIVGVWEMAEGSPTFARDLEIKYTKAE